MEMVVVELEATVLVVVGDCDAGGDLAGGDG